MDLRKLYIDSMRIFVRSKNLSLPYFGLLLLILAYFAYSLNNYLQYRDIFSVMIWLARASVFVVAFFIYCGYEMTAKIYDNGMGEYFKTYKHGLFKVFGTMILGVSTVVLVPTVMFFSFILFLYDFAGIPYNPLLIHLVKLSVLYFGLSFLIGALLGITMAAKLQTKRLAVYSLTVLFVLLNTTFTDVPFRIPRLLFNSYTTERVLYYIKDFLTVVPHELGSSFAVSPIYGFPMEPIRWQLALFWILFPLALIMSEAAGHKSSKRILTISSSLILLLGVGLFAFRGSVLLMDMRVDSYAYADPFYYMEKSANDYEPKPARFMIKEYNMDLTISNELHAEVEVIIDNPSLDAYEFTLYHGYRLRNVRTKTGNIPFEREGDSVRIPGLHGEDSIIFEYYGKSPKFYANRQAITLPGHFAWYPKPGRAEIWDRDRYGYVVNTPPYESNFVVDIQSDLRVFSNLEGSNNSFQGASNGLTLFAGMYAEIAENLYAEPLREDLPTRACIAGAEKALDDVFERLERPMPESVRGLANKRFFQAPRSFALNSNTDETVVMTDHVISTSCSKGEDLAINIVASMLDPEPEAVQFTRNFLGYLFGVRPPANLADTVSPDSLLAEIDEWQELNKKSATVDRDTYLSMDEQDRKTFIQDQHRQSSLGAAINDKAARYLFSESPHKEQNMQIFFDYFASQGETDYLAPVKNILKEEAES